MAEKTLADAFYETLKDVYFAEKAGLRSLKKAVKAAQAPQLKAVLTEHSEESQHQVERLLQVFEILGKPARSKTCEAMQGITSEMEEDLEDFGGSGAADEVLIGCAQAVEHYEIARYGLLAGWAKKLGMDDAASLLNETLEEEKQADIKLSRVAESLGTPAKGKKLPAEAEMDDGETKVKPKAKRA
jgi:ferritin-like metal-binding protein YciE